MIVTESTQRDMMSVREKASACIILFCFIMNDFVVENMDLCTFKHALSSGAI
jgi:hypothetical protein